MNLFVDLDGVMADFDSHYATTFGVPCNKELDNVNWDLVRSHPNFFEGIPLMPDALELWDFLKPWNPIILTGTPKSVATAAANKKAMVARLISPDAEVRCCPASEKYLHCSPGDILIDDWTKHKSAWTKAGGIWITHTSAKTTISELTWIALTGC